MRFKKKCFNCILMLFSRFKPLFSHSMLHLINLCFTVFRTINVLKFRTLVGYKKGIDISQAVQTWVKLSDRVFPVCYSDMHFLTKFFLLRPPDKSAHQKIIFLFSQPKHMLWVLKRTVSMRQFF